MEIPRDYSVHDLARFHGHLGPFIVLGYRMGRYALNALNADPFELKAQVFCNGITPQSCMADGIQLGSGCTLGKGNIEIIKSESLFGTFCKDEKKIKITPHPLKTLDQNDPDYELAIERYAQSLYDLKDEELFKVDGL